MTTTQRTEAQIAASRENGAKGHGPVTREGKEQSAQNALKHGMTALRVTIPGEDPADLARLPDRAFRAIKTSRAR